jgi:hypothetical protein
MIESSLSGPDKIMLAVGSNGLRIMQTSKSRNMSAALVSQISLHVQQTAKLST